MAGKGCIDSLKITSALLNHTRLWGNLIHEQTKVTIIANPGMMFWGMNIVKMTNRKAKNCFWSWKQYAWKNNRQASKNWISLTKNLFLIVSHFDNATKNQSLHLILSYDITCLVLTTQRLKQFQEIHWLIVKSIQLLFSLH